MGAKDRNIRETYRALVKLINSDPEQYNGIFIRHKKNLSKLLDKNNTTLNEHLIELRDKYYILITDKYIIPLQSLDMFTDSARLNIFKTLKSESQIINDAISMFKHELGDAVTYGEEIIEVQTLSDDGLFPGQVQAVDDLIYNKEE